MLRPFVEQAEDIWQIHERQEETDETEQPSLYPEIQRGPSKYALEFTEEIVLRKPDKGHAHRKKYDE